eukprot:251944-Amphidinium_carterae.1
MSTTYSGGLCSLHEELITMTMELPKMKPDMTKTTTEKQEGSGAQWLDKTLDWSYGVSMR